MCVSGVGGGRESCMQDGEWSVCWKRVDRRVSNTACCMWRVHMTRCTDLENSNEMYIKTILNIEIYKVYNEINVHVSL